MAMREILERQRKIDDRLDEIASLSKEIKYRLNETLAPTVFNSGMVDKLSVREGVFFYLNDDKTWESRLNVSVTDDHDSFYVQAKAGGVLPAHQHVQSETIVMHKGSVEVYSWRGDLSNKPDEPEILKAGDMHYIPPYYWHEIKALEDCHLDAIFSPPLNVVI